MVVRYSRITFSLLLLNRCLNASCIEKLNLDLKSMFVFCSAKGLVGARTIVNHANKIDNVAEPTNT